jgi:hypothetical protein
MAADPGEAVGQPDGFLLFVEVMGQASGCRLQGESLAIVRLTAQMVRPTINLRALSAILIAVAAFCFCETAGAKGQTTKPPFSLTLVAENVTLKTGSPVWVNITLKNKSKYSISAYTEGTPDQGGFVYKADVWDEKGSTAPETKFGGSIQGHDTPEELRREPYIIVTSGGEGSLAPNKTVTDRIDVTRLYDLNRPDEYTIQLQRFDLESNTWIKSNKVKVRVIP